ncbi:MAG: hypothetical protein EZS28_025304 [Streblomastix strix]|uniref:Uncharacterized protein n=1 Tax=Streblomastix strix TaxID=222440 RepID=A0A5J4V9G2_9EUKA|nr:MAG: hypothetical protein EZS28_025304 [Streblomastix strix]
MYLRLNYMFSSDNSPVQNSEFNQLGVQYQDPVSYEEQEDLELDDDLDLYEEIFDLVESRDPGQCDEVELEDNEVSDNKVGDKSILFTKLQEVLLYQGEYSVLLLDLGDKSDELDLGDFQLLEECYEQTLQTTELLGLSEEYESIDEEDKGSFDLSEEETPEIVEEGVYDVYELSVYDLLAVVKVDFDDYYDLSELSDNDLPSQLLFVVIVVFEVVQVDLISGQCPGGGGGVQFSIYSASLSCIIPYESTKSLFLLDDEDDPICGVVIYEYISKGILYGDALS